MNATAQVPARLPKFQLNILASLTGRWSIFEKNLYKIKLVYVSTETIPSAVSLTKNDRFLMNMANSNGTENSNEII